MSIEFVLERIVLMASNHPFVAIGSLFPIIPLVVGWRFRKYFTSSSKAIFIFILVFILTDIPIWITAAYRINNLFYLYLRDLLLLFSLFFLYLIGLKDKKVRLLLWSVISLMIFTILVQILTFADAAEFNWINRMILAGISLSYFFRLLQNPVIKDILIFPFFWFNSGILLNCLSTLMIYMAFNFSLKPGSKNQFVFTYISEIAFVVMFLFFAIGFWVLKKNNKYRKNEFSD
jgi:hypothetical protein